MPDRAIDPERLTITRDKARLIKTNLENALRELRDLERQAPGATLVGVLISDAARLLDGVIGPEPKDDRLTVPVALGDLLAMQVSLGNAVRWLAPHKFAGSDMVNISIRDALGPINSNIRKVRPDYAPALPASPQK